MTMTPSPQMNTDVGVIGNLETERDAANAHEDGWEF